MNSKRVLAILLSIVMIFAVVLTGCSKNDNVNDATPDEVSSVDEVSQTETTTEATKATEATKKDSTKKPTNNDKKDDNKSEDKNEPTYTAPKSADPTTCVVTVANKEYTVKVGSIITYTCYLKTPTIIEDCQAKINYTASGLKLLNDSADKMYPVLGSSVISNTKNNGLVNFNAVNINDGYDFTSKSALVTLRFEVLQASSVAVKADVEYVTGVGGKPFIDSSKIVSGVDASVEETLKY